MRLLCYRALTQKKCNCRKVFFCMYNPSHFSKWEVALQFSAPSAPFSSRVMDYKLSCLPLVFKVYIVKALLIWKEDRPRLYVYGSKDRRIVLQYDRYNLCVRGNQINLLLISCRFLVSICCSGTCSDEGKSCPIIPNIFSLSIVICLINKSTPLYAGTRVLRSNNT